LSDLKAQGTRAFIWDFIGKIASQGMSIVIMIVLARLLNPSDFGLIAIVMVIIGIANVFRDLGLSGALIQRKKVLPIHYSSVFYFNLFIGTILTLTIYFSSPWISQFYNNQELIPLMQVMSLTFLLGAFSSVQTTLLHKELNYALATKIKLISSLSSGVLGVALAYFGAGVWSLVAQTLSMGVIYNIIIWYVSQWKPRFAFSWKALKQLWAFGFNMFLSGIIEAVYTRLDFMIIGKVFTLEILGYFQQAKSMSAMLVQYSSGSLVSVLFPVLSKIQHDLPRYQNVIIKAHGIISFSIFLLIGASYLISEELIVLVFGDKWLPSVAIFKILILSGFSYPIGSLMVSVLSSRGKSKAFLRLEIYKKMVGSVNLLVLYFFGIDIFLYGLIIQAVINNYFNILFAAREIKLGCMIFVKPIIIQVCIAITGVVLTTLMTSNMELTDIPMLMIKGSIFILLYILMNILFKTNSFQYVREQVPTLLNQKVRKGAKKGYSL